jgi:hypothetical protein
VREGHSYPSAPATSRRAKGDPAQIPLPVARLGSKEGAAVEAALLARGQQKGLLVLIGAVSFPLSHLCIPSLAHTDAADETTRGTSTVTFGTKRCTCCWPLLVVDPADTRGGTGR